MTAHARNPAADLGAFLFSFQGRVPRRLYWLRFVLPYFVLALILTLLDHAAGTWNDARGVGLLTGIYVALTIWPGLAIGAKRCHDRNRSGWFQLVSFIPLVGFVWLLVELGFLRGTAGPNRFGPDPLGQPPPV